MTNPTAPGPRNGILSLTIKDKSVLYAAYMPFVKHGGLFIPTNKNYRLGDEVFMLLNLMDEAEKIPVAGRVVWVTPKGAQMSPSRSQVCPLASAGGARAPNTAPWGSWCHVVSLSLAVGSETLGLNGGVEELGEAGDGVEGGVR